MSSMEQPSRSRKRVRKLLSLDGGGVRGLSSIMILSILMTHINRGREKKDPWQEFDMIGGTSTGGLLAIMLGRLRMSVRDCERSYAELSGAIFAPRRSRADIVGRGIDFLKANGRFDESPLEKSIKAKIVAARMEDDALLEDSRPDACKVFVCATQVADSSPTLIRSYENPEVFGDLLGVKIWEAARATSAATTFFDPIQIGDYGELFADGALRHNNPIYQVYQEAKDLWPDDDYLLLSIGTGNAPGQSINEGLRSLVEQLVKIATETEETARLFYKNHLEMVSANRLFRFNVYHGLGTIGLDESKEIHQIASRTRTYLNEPEVVRKAKLCVIGFKNAADYEATQDNHLLSTEKDTIYAISAGGEGASAETVRLWDAVTGMARQTLAGHSGAVCAVAFSPDSKLVASGSADNTVRLWNAATGTARQTLAGHWGTACATFSPDGKLVASGSEHMIMLWDAATGAARQTLKGHSNNVHAVAFSPDGKLVASGSGDNTVRLWDAATGAARQTLKGHSKSIYVVAFSPDGKLVASGSGDNTVRLWDAAMGVARQTLKGHSKSVFAVAFSPDGRLVASGSEYMIMLWDAATGAARQTLKGHSSSVYAVAFSPDGKLVASGSWDKTVRLWDAATGTAWQTLKGHSKSVFAVAFSPDGKLVASGSLDKTVRLWDLLCMY